MAWKRRLNAIRVSRCDALISGGGACASELILPAPLDRTVTPGPAISDSCSGAVTLEPWGESVAKDKADLLRQLRAYLSAAAKSEGDVSLPE